MNMDLLVDIQSNKFCFPLFFKAMVMYVCVSDFLLSSDWMSWRSKNPYVSHFPSLKHNHKYTLNFNKLLVIYIINRV